VNFSKSMDYVPFLKPLSDYSPLSGTIL